MVKRCIWMKKTMNDNKRIQIGLIGDSQIRSKQQNLIAYEIGKTVARNNAILICGGRGGVMEAACKGVYEEGGISVGILPYDINDQGMNEFLTVRIPTQLGMARNAIIPLASDGIIACGGGAGTLSEISFTSMYGKPLVCITSVPGWSKEIGERGYIDHRDQNSLLILKADSGEHAVQKILKILSRTK